MVLYCEERQGINERNNIAEDGWWIKGRLVSGWEGERDAGKGEGIRIPVGGNVEIMWGGGYRAKQNALLKSLKALHYAAGPSLAASTAQPDQALPRERLLG